MKKLRLFLAAVASLSVLAIPALLNPAMALDCTQTNLTAQQALQCGTNGAGGNNQTPEQATNSLNGTISSVLNILSVAIGILAVVMILSAGLRYITSGGSKEKVSSAKNALVYAVIGLVIVALAQIIVQFVLSKTTAYTATTCPAGQVEQNGQCVTPRGL